MNVKKIISVILISTAMGATFTMTNLTSNASAKSVSSLKVFPKRFRGTWYHYEKNDKGKFTYSTMRFTKNKDFENWRGARGDHSSVAVLHQYNHTKPLPKKIKDNWLVAHLVKKSLRVNSWVMPGVKTNKTYLNSKNSFFRYDIKTRSLNGNKIKFLSCKIMFARPIDNPYYYRTKALAKKSNPKGYNYDNGYGYGH